MDHSTSFVCMILSISSDRDIHSIYIIFLVRQSAVTTLLEVSYIILITSVKERAQNDVDPIYESERKTRQIYEK